MTDYQRIILLLLEGSSYRDIEGIVGCSHREIGRARRVIAEHRITDPGAITGEQLDIWFPDGRRRVSAEYEQPDFGKVLVRMRSARHFTLLQAWRRYTDQPAAGGLKKYGYSQFCALFAEHVQARDLVATLHHDPGKAMFVDWAGDTLELVDAASGEVTRAYLFTAVLPYSGVIFVRAYSSMKSPEWLAGHVDAFGFFGGVPQLVVPDNPATATHRRQRHDAERVVNARYQQLADHYSTAIVPARVKRPRDKAAVERAVKTINTRVIGYLDGEVFHTLAQLNEAIGQRLEEINHAMPRADGSTRWQRFEADEQPLLAALPQDRFEEVSWKEPRVGRNYHVTIDTQRYSVPYAYAGQLVRARITAGRVTVFDRADRVIAEHALLSGRKGQYATDPAHVPEQHRDIDGLWSRNWFITRAERFGPATVWALTQLLDRPAIEAHGYLDCQNVLDGLGAKNRQRLEAACELLKRRDAHVTYTTIKRTMAGIAGDEQAPTTVHPAASTAKKTPTDARQAASGVFVRDASHYEGMSW